MSMSTRRLIIAMTTGLLGGCGEAVPIAPPDIHYGDDVCAVCGMIISDDRFAAGLVAEGPGGLEARAFDDIGCLLDDLALHEDRLVAGRWVRDFRTDQWRRAGTAVFVHSAAVHSPMSYGLAACGDDTSARVLLAEFPGEVLDFGAVRERFESDQLVMIPSRRDGAPDDP